ncbi:MAG: hypothetical protein ACRES5_07425, partial [Pseudomonas sp.]
LSEFLAWALGSIASGLSSFACSGGYGEGEGGVPGSEIAESGELRPGDHEREPPQIQHAARP